jgi:hypothetical protein
MSILAACCAVVGFVAKLGCRLNSKSAEIR